MDVREGHQSLACHAHPDRALNPQPRHVPAHCGLPVYGTMLQPTEPPSQALLEPVRDLHAGSHSLERARKQMLGTLRAVTHFKELVLLTDSRIRTTAVSCQTCVVCVQLRDLTLPAGSESGSRQNLAGQDQSRRSPAARKGRAAQLWDWRSCRPPAPLQRPQGDPL